MTIHAVFDLTDNVGEERSLGDLRFGSLMPEGDWLALPPPVRKRFSRRLAGGNTIVYVGEVVETTHSTAGWLLAQAARLIGGPLPIGRDSHVPSVVSVTEDVATGGQTWTRLYARRGGFPQIVNSSKRFAGRTGLEEHVGGGVGMSLTIGVDHGALVFRSNDYFIDLFGLRLKIPDWATPGAITVTHAECGGRRFSFTLDMKHPRFGTLIRQVAIFKEARS